MSRSVRSAAGPAGRRSPPEGAALRAGGLRERLQRRGRALWLRHFGPENHWARAVLNRDVEAFLDGLALPSLDAVEVSGSTHESRAWRSYRRLDYPAFDLCAPPEHLEAADVVFCEQVLEHVVDPVRAARTLRDLTRPAGWVVVSTPFLIRIHRSPEDFWRFTPAGLEVLLRAGGLEVERVASWGNRSAVRSNLRRRWTPYRPWRSLRPDEDVPLVVWAYARRPPG